MENQEDVQRERCELKVINNQDKINDHMINYEKKRFLYYYYAFMGVTFFTFYLKYKSHNAYYVFMKYVYGLLFISSPLLYMYMMHHLFNTQILDRVQMCEKGKNEIKNTNIYYNKDEYMKIVKSYYDSIQLHL